jgi:metal-responsive CopG/Arc/MetJ family transcriptional regulator
VSLELPEELVEAIDARKDSMGFATRGEVLSGLMSWMLKDPLDDGSAG